MVCVNNPCSDMLPKVGDKSPIVGDEYDGQISNLNNVATHFSGGRRHRTRRSRKSYKKGGASPKRKGGKRRTRRHRKSRHSKRH